MGNHSFRHTISHEKGLHMRVAGKIVSIAAEYNGSIEITNMRNDRIAQGKSAMGLLLLNAMRGDEVKINIKGPNISETEARLNREL